MNNLRLMLLGLAAVVLVALGWRLASAPHPATPPTQIAAARPPLPPPPATPPPAPPPAARLVEPPPAPAPGTAATGQVAAPPEKVADAPPAMTAQEAQARLVADLQQAPDLARAFDALRAQFPAVADRSLGEATEAFRASGTLPAPDDLFAAAMRDLRLTAGVLAARAGAEALGAIFEAKATVLADLEQADPRICADYIYGGTSPEFADFEAAHRTLVARSALATIGAMADGKTRQMHWGDPSNDDFHWIENALGKRGLSPDEIAALLDGRSPDTPPTDARLCDNARTYLDVLKAMPIDARNRVYGRTAELLARS